VEEDALTIVEDEVAYKLGPEFEVRESGTEESSGDPVIPEPPPAAPTPDSRTTAAPQPRNEDGSSREPQWKDIDLSSFEFPETPFKRVREELTNL
jgi:hypothetical protein